VDFPGPLSWWFRLDARCWSFVGLAIIDPSEIAALALPAEWRLGSVSLLVFDDIESKLIRRLV
jgi:hypothetical protein